MKTNRKTLVILSLVLVMVFVVTLVSNAGFLDNIFGGKEEKAKTTITFWHIYTSEQAAAYKPINDAIKRFEADHPNIDIKQTPIENDSYKTKLKVAMGANNAPDIFQNWGAGGLKTYVDSGKVYDMTSELEAGFKNRFVSGTLDLGEFNGKNYAIPGNNMSAAFVWYNKEMFNKYGLEEPKTFEELVNIAKTLKENGIIPFSLANKDKWTGSMYFMYLADRLGGPEAFEHAADRKEGGAFNTPPFVKAGDMIQNMVDKGYFPKGVNGLEEDSGQSRNLLYTNKAAMYLMGSWAYGAIKNENPEFLDKLDFFVFPKIESGEGNSTNLIGTSGSAYYSVSQRSNNKQVAIEFLKYLSDNKARDLFVERGNIPPIKGVGEQLENPIMKKIYRKFEAANHIQLWYDQYLPPQLAEVHLNTTQALFGLDMTPKKAADKMEQEATEFYQNN